MKIFIDTAELKEIKKAYSWGIVDGVTTNPSLIKKAVDARDEINIEEYINEICQAVEGPVSLEVIGTTFEEMISEAETLYERFNPINDNVVVKIPVNPHTEDSEVGPGEGLKAIKYLSEEGIPVNTTLIMKPEQALLAAKAGAKYVSPFAGRIDDYIRSGLGLQRGEDYGKGDYFDYRWLEEANEHRLKSVYGDLEDKELGDIYLDEEINKARAKVHDEGIKSGVDLVRSIKQIFENYDLSTEVLAASIRNSPQLREVAEAGADIATLPYNVIKEMLYHYKTKQGVISFTQDVVPDYEALFS